MSQTVAEYAAKHGLTPVGTRPPLGSYLRSLWDYRMFVYQLGRNRVQAQVERTKFGLLWMVIKPILNALIYGSIFGLLLSDNFKGGNFTGFIIIGIFLFEYISSSLSQGAKAITSNGSLVRSLKFPRAVLPLAELMKLTISFGPILAVMFVALVITGTMPNWRWLLIVPFLLILMVFNAGVILVVARLTVHFRDMTNIIPFINRILFYTCGVFFRTEAIVEHYPTLGSIISYIPPAAFLRLGRGIMLPEYAFTNEWMTWVYCLVWAVAIFVVGLIFFWRAEAKYGQDI